MNRSKKARIFIVDDHPVVREGLGIQFGAQADLEVCGEAEDANTAFDGIKHSAPDVAVIDLSLKSSSGLDLIKRLRASNTAVRLLVWSMYPESLFAERALRAGAQGYVHKGRATREILDAVRTVLSGKVYLSGDLSDRLLHRLVGHGQVAAGSPVDGLSDRELEAFELMGQGMTTDQIAHRMHVSPKTVETYRARIKEKLGLTSMAELIQRAALWVLECK